MAILQTYPASPRRRQLLASAVATAAGVTAGNLIGHAATLIFI